MLAIGSHDAGDPLEEVHASLCRLIHAFDGLLVDVGQQDAASCPSSGSNGCWSILPSRTSADCRVHVVRLKLLGAELTARIRPRHAVALDVLALVTSSYFERLPLLSATILMSRLFFRAAAAVETTLLPLTIRRKGCCRRRCTSLVVEPSAALVVVCRVLHLVGQTLLRNSSSSSPSPHRDRRCTGRSDLLQPVV